MDSRQPSKKDRQLFGLIAHDVRIHADDYRDAGRWLDEYTGEEAYWKRQEAELKKLTADMADRVEIRRRVHDLEERIQERRTPALLVRFQEARTYLTDENEGQVLISIDRAKRVVLVSWLLTDPDAEKAQVQLTNCQRWAWEPTNDLTQMSRGVGYALWAASGAAYEAWVGLAQAAWDRIKLNREAGLLSNTTPRESAMESNTDFPSHEDGDEKRAIFGDSLNLGIITVYWRDAIHWLRHLKGWRKVIAVVGAGVTIILIIAFITRSLWAPLID